MSRPCVVLLRGHSANPWDLRPWELLLDRYDVRVLVTGSNAFDTSSLALPVERVKAVRDLLPKGRAGDLAALAAGDRYLQLEPHLRGADIVHAAEIGVPYSHGPALLKAKLGYALVLTAWETIPFGDAYRRFRGRRYRAETIPQVDLFLAATERARRALVLEGAPGDRIEVAPPGIDVDRFGAGAADPPREHLVLSAGRLVWEKGHQDVLRALGAFRRGLVSGTVPRALIVGAGPEEQRLKSVAWELGIADLVEWRRSVPYDEMPAVYAQASALVLASLPTTMWEEQFGMVLAEGLAAGLPIFAAASGAIPEVLDGAGTLFEPGDWLGLAQRLADLTLRPPWREQREELVLRYSTEWAARRLATAYERVLASSAR